MRDQKTWATAFFGIVILLMSGVTRGDEWSDTYIFRGSRPSPIWPGLTEYRFSYGESAVYDCWEPPTCAYGDCEAENCAHPFGVWIDCAEGYCDAPPGHNWGPFCHEGTFTCSNLFNGCVLAYDTCGNVDSLLRRALAPKIYIKPCKDPNFTDLDYDWLPTYGDMLCFKIEVTRPMNVSVGLWNSTYEGMCMNRDVPVDDTARVNDIFPLNESGCIPLVPARVGCGGPTDPCPGFFIGSADLTPGSPGEIHLAVQDFGADARLLVCKTNEPTRVLAVQEIPIDFYDRVIANGTQDPDSDGLTNWEEYRGFWYDSTCSWWCHRSARYGGQMDSSRREIFIRDESDFLVQFGFMPLITATGYYPILAQNWPTNRNYYRMWLDSNFQYYLPNGGTLEPNYLTEAGYDPPAGQNSQVTLPGLDQVILRFERNDNLPQSPSHVFGWAPQYPITSLPLFRGPSGTIGCDDGCMVPYGYDSDGAIEISMVNVDWQISIFVDDPYYLPPNLYDQVWCQWVTRLYLHELGHALGIDHHNPVIGGSHDCVMKYEPNTGEDWFVGGAWSQYNWGAGYMDDEYDCANQKGLRP